MPETEAAILVDVHMRKIGHLMETLEAVTGIGPRCDIVVLGPIDVCDADGEPLGSINSDDNDIWYFRPAVG